MKVLIPTAFISFLLLTACDDDPNAWTEEKKQVIIDKCDSEMFDCDCYLKVTMETFPNAQDYNATMEDEEKNGDKIDAYWDKIYDECMSE